MRYLSNSHCLKKNQEWSLILKLVYNSFWLSKNEINPGIAVSIKEENQALFHELDVVKVELDSVKRELDVVTRRNKQLVEQLHEVENMERGIN